MLKLDNVEFDFDEDSVADLKTKLEKVENKLQALPAPKCAPRGKLGVMNFPPPSEWSARMSLGFNKRVKRPSPMYIIGGRGHEYAKLSDRISREQEERRQARNNS